MKNARQEKILELIREKAFYTQDELQLLINRRKSKQNLEHIFVNDKKYYYKNITYSLRELMKYFDSIQFNTSLTLINSVDDNFILYEYDNFYNNPTFDTLKNMISHLILLQQKSMSYDKYFILFSQKFIITKNWKSLF